MKLNKNCSRFEEVANLRVYVFHCPDCRKRADGWCSNDYCSGNRSVVMPVIDGKRLRRSTPICAYMKC